MRWLLRLLIGLTSVLRPRLQHPTDKTKSLQQLASMANGKGKRRAKRQRGSQAERHQGTEAERERKKAAS